MKKYLKNMELYDVIAALEKIAPPELAEEFDHGRIGLTLGSNKQINKIVVALDPTEYVIKRAAQINADLLITHHTLIFNSVNLIPKGLADILKIALDNEIALYSMHTNFDKAKGGINDVLAKRLGLANIENCEIGRIGTIEPCSADTFANHVAKSLGTHIQFTGKKDEIRKVMVFGGSGFRNENLEFAKENDVDAYVSAELKHDIIRSWENMMLVDATHYATENPGMQELCTTLEEKLKIDVEFIEHNPLIKTL